MSVFICKMCGGTLEIHDNETVAVCEYCGTKQTLPKLDSDKRMNLYDRASHFRRNNDFDKAMNLYEQILSEDNTDAEAYWSIVLCRYGIEYVEDPESHKRIPTVNRTQYTSIYSDADYQSALKYADGAQRAVYEEEAEAIDAIQKGILEISAKEEPFDVFICYKETDSRGRRTPDSVLANDLYHELTEEGFKVFFSRITLEDKLGIAYEPYIFAALNSAKVMVVIGTKPEYFNAVWVRNEWSRYLALIKNGAKKMLIPAYRDMDPYDLPEEFAHLQAQDMSKLGFMQDLIRGIKKIAQAHENKDPVSDTVKSASAAKSSNSDVSPLLKRVFMFLEDGEFDEADEYCEKVLDHDPENALAYLGKLMADLCVGKREELAECEESFEDSNDYKKILRFGDDALKQEVQSYSDIVNKRIENERKDSIYNDALNKMEDAMNSTECCAALNAFEQIMGWKDVDKQIDICKEKIDKLKKREEAARIERLRKFNRNKKIFFGIICAAAFIALLIFIFEKIRINIIIPNRKYNYAMNLYDEKQYNQAINVFKELDGYRDSETYMVNCKYNMLINRYDKEMVDKVYNKNIGDICVFGNFEQDNDASNGAEPIDWIVLDKNQDAVLLISKQGIDCSAYQNGNLNKWQGSLIRNWLNNAFYDEAFNSNEQKIIKATELTGEYGNDKVFILNAEQALKYFKSDDERLCKATEYAISRGADVRTDSADCYWWLRGAGKKDLSIKCVNNEGVISYEGENANDSTICIRPALWIDLKP